MRKSSLHIMEKKTLCISLILLLIVSIALASMPRMHANPSATVYVDPAEYVDLLVGQNFTVDVKVLNVSRLAGWQFKLRYNTTILNATWCTLTSISEQYSAYLVPAPWSPTRGIRDDLGFVTFAATFPNDPDNPFSGSGSLLTINFTCTAEGSSNLALTVQALDSITPDYDISSIEHTVESGSVTVMSKPPLPLISLNPMEFTVLAGDSFTVDVNITDATGLENWEFKLNYNTTILDAIEVTYEGQITENNTDWLPTDPNTHELIPINDELGRVWVGAKFPPGDEFTGSGTLLTINFTATAPGSCTLHLYDTILKDALGELINHDIGPDCSVTVMSKPPLPLISLNPMEFTVLAGDSFTVDVNITDATNLQDYEFQLWFDNILLNATDVAPGPINPLGTLFIPDPLQNVSDGFVWAGASLPTGQAFNGSGILMTINFTALVAGECTLHLNETALTDSMEIEIDHVTLDGSVTVLLKIADFHTHHINDATDAFPNDYAPMVIPVNGKSVTIAPVITCTTFEDDVWKPNHHPCKLAETLVVDDDWSDNDADYTYMFEDWTDYDWNDIVISLYAVTNNLIINAETCLESREAAWKNPFGVELTPEGLAVEVHWNSTDYPEEHTIKVNPEDTLYVELFAESNSSDTAFITIIPLIPPTASFVYSPPQPYVCENVTFNASASTPNGGYIVSYEWDFGDYSPHEFDMVVTHHYTAPGTYDVTLNVTNNLGVWDTETKTITIAPRRYTLTITSTAGGTTDPVPDHYSYDEGTIVSITAISESGYVFDYWELDSAVRTENPIAVTMNMNHILHAVFKEAPSPAVGGHAAPIDKSHFLDLKIGLSPEIGLVSISILLAAIAVTITLIRRRTRH